MIKSARADREKICVLMMTLFCRNTLCIARKSDEIRAQIFRETPQAIYSAFTQGEVTDMSTLQARIYAEKWFELAINKNKLADFVIGLPPYAEHRSDDGEIPMPLLGPNAEVLYDYHAENKDAHFDTDVQNAVLQIVEDNGNDAYVLLHALIFIVTQLAYEKRGTATFAMDCPKLLDAIRRKLTKNEKKLSKENGSEELWDLIECYDRLLCEQYNMISVF